MDDEHADDLLRTSPDRRRTPPRPSRCASAGCRVCEQLTVVFHGRRDLGTIQTYVTHGGHGAGTAVGADELLRVPCDLDLGRRRGPRGGRAALRRAGRRAARRAGRRRHRARRLARAARGPRAHDRVDVDRRLELDVRLPAHRLLPAALVAPEQQIVVTAVCGARAARRGPPADGHRLRAAGRRARLPAARRPGALPRGLPRARRRARAPRWRAARRARRPRSQRFLELSGDDFHAATRRSASAQRAVRRVALWHRHRPSAVFVFLGISFLLARALTGRGRGARGVLDVVRAQARGDADGGARRSLPACAGRARLRAA